MLGSKFGLYDEIHVSCSVPARPAKISLGGKPSSDDEQDGCYNCDSRVNASMMKASTTGRTSTGDRKFGGKESCSWFEIQYLVKEIAKKTGGKKYDCMLGIANGGVIPAKLLAEELRIDSIQLIPVRNKEIVVSDMLRLDKKKMYLVIDDIHDTGVTHDKVAKVLRGYKCDYAFCMSRYDQDAGIYGRILNHNRWIVFPWEASSDSR